MIGSAISCRQLVKRYGHRRALDGFSLEVPRGSVLGVVGDNGAGKTTWMMTVAGLLSLDGGEIDILGRGAFNAAVHSGRLAILPQDSDLPLECPVESLLYGYARLQGLSASEARKSVVAMLKAVNLADRAGERVRSLSHGMRKRVMLAQCFLGEPEVVLLDEPLNGLDPTESARMRMYIQSLRGKRTVVVSSHNLHDIEEMCTHVAVVAKGRVSRVGPVATFTDVAHRVEYVLSAEPKELAALEAALPGATFSFDAAERRLVCTFVEGEVAMVNRVLLPLLLKEVEVLAVTPGQSLEQALLK